jgi:HEAT repeat protein
MATRPSLEDKLAALRKLRGQALTPEHTPELRKALGDRSNLVVAAAAEIVGENALIEFARELEAAFAGFLANPTKDDKLCRAKIAIVQALDKMEHLRSEVFEKAVVHIQEEPVWGGSEDTAGPMRAAALIALARIEGSSSLPRLVDALIDPLKDVRIAAAMALGAVGTEAAGLLLRLKTRIGDREPDVFSECLSGLLTANSREYLGFVAGFLDPGAPAGCEAAALALGKSRLPEALDPLRECWTRCPSRPFRQRILLAIAMMRLPAAIDFLLGLVAADFEEDATDALSALKIHNYDDRLRDRLETVVRQTGSPALRARFERDFRPDR